MLFGVGEGAEFRRKNEKKDGRGLALSTTLMAFSVRKKEHVDRGEGGFWLEKKTLMERMVETTGTERKLGAGLCRLVRGRN